MKDCYAGTVSTLKTMSGRVETRTQEDGAAVSYKLALIRFRGDSVNKT